MQIKSRDEIKKILELPEELPVSVIDLSPIPRMSEKHKRKRTGVKSEVITSSPFKEYLEEKLKVETEKSARKKVKKPVLRSLSPQPGPPGISRPSNSVPQKEKDEKRKKDILCPLCNERFVEPPIEEWIQCFSCGNWWHEECTSYESGVFTCDFCNK